MKTRESETRTVQDETGLNQILEAWTEHLDQMEEAVQKSQKSQGELEGERKEAKYLQETALLSLGQKKRKSSSKYQDNAEHGRWKSVCTGPEGQVDPP